MSNTYDYIVAGSGLAGLSFLYRLLKEERLQHKNILVIDAAQKTQNDRTWCFWEKEAGPFESLVCHQWETLQFFSPQVSKEFKMKAYRYKMIQSGDFYNHVLEFIQGFSNVSFVQEQILEIVEAGGKGLVKTEKGNYSAEYVFNSTSLFYPKMTEENTLLQHFLGWYIQTEAPIFDPKVGTLMDFTLPQTHGTTFMYVLPTAENVALVEYTLFTERILKEEEYEVALKGYIKDKLGIENYQITHTEFGVIPMSLARFPSYLGKNKRIVNIGTAGGYTKPSTGYTFQFVQKHIGLILAQLKENQSPIVTLSFREKMFEWYDRTLLDVLLTKSLSGEQIFSSLFKRVDPERILAFLANESGFWEEFNIRNSVPQFPFVFSGMKQLMGLGKQ
ncbi:lycopene cyclase family protein [Cecembia lonarensis]|uniref:Lycopene cyclase family protein n=1 Tax=Cecembia lonarensis (strain CCUG 58316 / KCTC 22772 / LW9) TaxID=1225176 RepID=K1LHU4_CECL9|nr:lycopene cyclase family protein [Cecembia lonarensis]EKB49803.1 lycopene cyclase family protein [Cecembia lonarensis LW9]